MRVSLPSWTPCFLLVLGLFFFSFEQAKAQSRQFLAGSALQDITPAKGDSHYRGKSQGTHDPLFARALVFEQGQEKTAIVICDLLNVQYDLTKPARKLASEKTGIPEANIIIAATHTHTGPLTHNDLKPDDKDTYGARVRDCIVQAIVDAYQSRRPAKLEAGKALQNPVISFNRRFYLKDGTVRMNPGLQNPAILRPEGPIDPEVGMLLIKDAKTNSPFAAFTNFALHLDTVGGALYSADYPYYIDQFFKAKYGKNFVSVFGTGTCGDINHLDVTKTGRQGGHEGGYQSTRFLGGALADTIRRNLDNPEVKPILKVTREVMNLPLQKFTDIELAWAKDEKAKPLYEERPFLQHFRRAKILNLEKLHKQYGHKLPVEVNVIRLSKDTALVFLPGEVFVELGMAIKNASPFLNTYVVELANNGPAYVPTRRAFANGDYETVNSRLVPGSGERMVQSAVRQLHALAEKSSKQVP